MEMRIYMNCPYCKKRVGHDVNFEHVLYVIRELVSCDPEEGGCDQLFLSEIRFRHEITLQKIEGYKVIENETSNESA